MTVDTLQNIWCAAKPVVFLATAAVFERSNVAFDEPVGQLCPLWSSRGRDSPCLDDILRHESNIAEPSAAMAFFAPDDFRRDLVAGAIARWKPDTAPAYSEYLATATCMSLIESLAGEPAKTVLERALRDHGIDDFYFTLSREQFARESHRIGTYFDRLEHAVRRPLVHDRTPTSCGVNDHSLATFATTDAVAAWYDAFLAQLEDSEGPSTSLFPSTAVLRDMLSRRRTETFDKTWERDVDFAAGFITNLEEELFLDEGTLAHASGHLGWLGATLGFVDHDRRIVVAVMVNGTVDGSQHFLDNRASLLAGVLRVLDE